MQVLGLNDWISDAENIAWSLGSVGPVFISSTIARFRHFATVFVARA